MLRNRPLGPLFPFKELDGEVAGHSGSEDGDENPELAVDADLGLEDVGKDEAEGFPKSAGGNLTVEKCS